jgi:nucleoside-diphosphate-sugar epimerase
MMQSKTSGTRVLVTGGTGFIGSRLVERLLRSGLETAVLAREVEAVSRIWPDGGVRAIYGDLSMPDELADPCHGVDIIYHLAGYAHADDSEGDAGAHLHRRITVDGTRALLASAARNHVGKIIFVSSVKAMGEGGPECLDESSAAVPASAYGRAKLEAENMLLQAAHDHDMHAVILRLPLVYGAGMKGNLDHMIRAVGRGWFPPLPKVTNKRSMVHVDDVVQAAILSASNSAARPRIYLVTDGQIYSTRQIFEWICLAFGRSIPSWSVPISAFRIIGWLGDVIGKIRGRAFLFDSNALEKLMGSSCYSSEKISRELGFRPTHTLRDSLPEMLAQYNDQRRV